MIGLRFTSDWMKSGANSLSQSFSVVDAKRHSHKNGFMYLDFVTLCDTEMYWPRIQHGDSLESSVVTSSRHSVYPTLV